MKFISGLPLILAAALATALQAEPPTLTPGQINSLQKLNQKLKTRVAPKKSTMPDIIEGKKLSAVDWKKRLTQMPLEARVSTYGLQLDGMGVAAQDQAIDQRAAALANQDLVSYELEVMESDPTKLTFDVVGEGTAEGVRVLQYTAEGGTQNASLCGPIMVLNRGQDLRIVLENKLKAEHEPVLDRLTPLAPGDFWNQDGPHELFTTNLHTHGLHVSPGGDHDNVFLSVGPVKKGDLFHHYLPLTYHLPKDHPAGTFWYHAHRHGSVAYQLANGMAGAIIVRGDESHKDDLENVDAIREANVIEDKGPALKDGPPIGRVMLLQQFIFTRVGAVQNGGNVKWTWVVDPGRVNDRLVALPQRNSNTIVARMISGDAADVTAVNGKPLLRDDPADVFTVAAGRVERWRFIHAGREAKIRLSWWKLDGQNQPQAADEVEMHEIAADGIPFAKPIERVADKNPLDLFPGYRSDVLVKIKPTATKGQTFFLMPDDKQPTLTDQNRLQSGSQAIAIITVGDPGKEMKIPDTLPGTAPTPDEITIAKQTHRDLAFTFADKQRLGVMDSKNAGDPKIGKPYAESGGIDSVKMLIGRSEEWEVSIAPVDIAGSPDPGIFHPFHIHVNPFWVPSYTRDKTGNEVGAWKDTFAIDPDKKPSNPDPLAAPHTGPTTIYMFPKDFAGRSVLHCHILDHEDQGMMRDVNIDSSKREDYAKLSLLHQANGRHDPLVEALKLRPRRTVLVFYMGATCEMCVHGLREVLARQEIISQQDADIVLIGAEKDPLASLNKLKPAIVQNPPDLKIISGIGKADHFKTGGLEDSKGSRLHGVIIIDENGNRRFQFKGDEPLSDTDEIVHALMGMKQGTADDAGN